MRAFASRGIVAVVLSALTVVGIPTAASGTPRSVNFCGFPSDLKFADIAPAGESAGDMRILKYTLTDKSGKKIGTATQLSTLVSTQPIQDAVARVAFRLPKGTLIVDAAPSFISGFLSPSAVPVSTKEYGVVLGGSGAYKGAHGSMSLKIVDPSKLLACWTADLA